MLLLSLSVSMETVDVCLTLNFSNAIFGIKRQDTPGAHVLYDAFDFGPYHLKTTLEVCVVMHW